MTLLSVLSQKLFSVNLKGVLQIQELQDLALFAIKATFLSHVPPAQENIKSLFKLSLFFGLKCSQKRQSLRHGEVDVKVLTVKFT